MKKLEIVDINNFTYILKDKNEKKFTCNFKFYNLESVVSVGDFIFINEEILKYPMLYSYGKIKDEDISENDILIIEMKSGKLYLQRYYG